MKVSATYLMRLAGLIILIFGGTLVIVYSHTGEVLMDQLIGASIGLVLLIGSFIWRMVKRPE